MDLSMDTCQRRIINPVWSSTYKLSQSSQLNVWPLRQQNHSKRFYGNTKLKSNATLNRNKSEIIPVTMKLEIDDYDKNKSYMSMAFCSTSKVKYMPLSGSNYDPFGTHHSIFPTLSRPNSRPVLLHGKRYTVIASETNRSNTSFSHSDQDSSENGNGNSFNSFKQDHFMTEQRKRFNEIELNKSNIKSKFVTETEIHLRKNYCLSGHQMKIRSLKSNIIDKTSLLQPSLTIQNHISSPRKSHKSYDHIFTPDTDNIIDLELEQTLSTYNNSESIISIDISDKVDKPTPLNVEEMLESIENDIEINISMDIDEETFVRSKEWVINYVFQCMDELSQMHFNGTLDVNDVDTFWRMVQPDLMDEDIQNYYQENLYKNHYIKIFQLAKSESIEISDFLNSLFPDLDKLIIRHYWTKIFEDLNIISITEFLFSNLISIQSNLHCVTREYTVEDECLSLTKMSFWISLFKSLWNSFDISLDDWIRKSTILLVNKNLLTDESKQYFNEQMTSYVSNNLIKNESRHLTCLTIIQTIPWIFRIHEKLFKNSFSIDEIANIRNMINGSNYPK